MTRTVGRAATWSDLGVDRRGWVVSGVFAVDGSTYETTFASEAELARFLDFAFASPIKPATTRLYLHPDEAPARPEHQVSNLRFQFDPAHRVAAAVLLVIDRDAGRLLSWRTVGDAGRLLHHDPQLRGAVIEWAFGDMVPPSAVSWTEVTGLDWF